VDPDYHDDREEPTESEKELLSKTQKDTPTGKPIQKNHYIIKRKRGYKEIQFVGSAKEVPKRKDP
jgi:hypothetical protein